MSLPFGKRGILLLWVHLWNGLKVGIEEIVAVNLRHLIAEVQVEVLVLLVGGLPSLFG
jgi:hypothetical protein